MFIVLASFKDSQLCNYFQVNQKMKTSGIDAEYSIVSNSTRLAFEEILLTLGELKLVIKSKPTENMYSIIITTD